MIWGIEIPQDATETVHAVLVVVFTFFSKKNMPDITEVAPICQWGTMYLIYNIFIINNGGPRQC